MTNQPNGVSPPPLTAIEFIIADLRAKRLIEDERANKLEIQLAKTRSRREMLDITIRGLSSEYGVKEVSSLNPEEDIQNFPVAGDTKQNVKHNKGSMYIPFLTSGNGEWVKPRGSWLDLVKKAIRHFDNGVGSQDVMDYLRMDEKARKDHHQTISGITSSYRDAGQLTGVLMYKQTPTGKILKQFLTGLPEFFDDVESKQLKPEYELKFREKAEARGFYLSEAEATRS